MSIGETAANGVNHTPSGTDSGEENISEVLFHVLPSDTREGFIARTPTRWHWEYDDNGFYCVTAYAAPSPYIVATGGEGETDKANAAFIVRAVNSHDDLLAALIEAEEEIHHPGSANYNGKDVAAIVRAAIRKATGETP